MKIYKKVDMVLALPESGRCVTPVLLHVDTPSRHGLCLLCGLRSGGTACGELVSCGKWHDMFGWLYQLDKEKYDIAWMYADEDSSRTGGTE